MRAAHADFYIALSLDLVCTYSKSKTTSTQMPQFCCMFGFETCISLWFLGQQPRSARAEPVERKALVHM